MTAVPICLQLERQAVWRAFSRAWANTGNRIAARTAMMAMTTSSSMRVKALRCRMGVSFTRLLAGAQLLRVRDGLSLDVVARRLRTQVLRTEQPLIAAVPESSDHRRDAH